MHTDVRQLICVQQETFPCGRNVHARVCTIKTPPDIIRIAGQLANLLMWSTSRTPMLDKCGRSKEYLEDTKAGLTRCRQTHSTSGRYMRTALRDELAVAAEVSKKSGPSCRENSEMERMERSRSLMLDASLRTRAPHSRGLHAHRPDGKMTALHARTSETDQPTTLIKKCGRAGAPLRHSASLREIVARPYQYYSMSG